jgi:pyruvate kinase
MRKVIEATESHELTNLKLSSVRDYATVPDAISRAIPLLCKTLPITKVVAITRSGYAANMISRAKLTQPIIAVSDDYMAAKSFNLIPGATGIHSKIPFSKITSDHIFEIIKNLYLAGILDTEDKIVVAGISYPTQGSRMNTIQIYEIANLVHEFSW